MSIPLSYTGSEWTSPDHASGYGTSISNPSTFLSDMASNGLYYQEGAGEIDVIFINAEGFLVSLYKSFTNQKLLQSFVITARPVSSDNKLRFIHRNLATLFTFEQALKSVGVNVTASDDYSGAMTTINQQLVPYYIQVYKST